MEKSDYNHSISPTGDKRLADAKRFFESDPHNLRLFDKYVQLLIRNNESSLAESLIANSPLLKNTDVETGIVHAHLLYKLKKYHEADAMFDELILKFSDNQKLRVLYAHTLRKRKIIIKAYDTIKPLEITNLDKKQRLIYEEIVTIYKGVEKKEKRPLQKTDDFCILSMKHAILHFKNTNITEVTRNELGKISLITGTLGPGGAERQLCLTAVNINKKKNSGELVAGVRIKKEVDVLINIFDSDEEKRFFLPFLKENRVNLFQVKDMTVTPIEKLSIDSPMLLNLLNETPSVVRYGLNRLVQYFRQAKTEVAFVWQDGAILFTALAALVAEVPKIVLNFRGFPPSLRPHLFKPEYYLFYKSLAEISKVTFVTNTKATAKAYADWLDIPREKFTVIYNGIVPPGCEPGSQDEATWSHFDSQTRDATETIGGVFRFETDKRPLLMIRFIYRYLKKNKKARFILVGEGRLRKPCMSLAEELGISHRILFTGLRKAVGYWVLKMDAMMLMSLYEGLPNALIEAQYLGVPVVSTPAGGAQECFIPGETGYVLSDAVKPDLKEACHTVSKLIQQFKNNPDLKNKATRFASSYFSISGLIENTVRTLTRSNLSMEQSVCEQTV